MTATDITPEPSDWREADWRDPDRRGRQERSEGGDWQADWRGEGRYARPRGRSAEDWAREGRSWLGRAEDWLDARGKGAWIAAMVLGFVFFWPIGLALLAYMIWSKRMFSKSCTGPARHRHGHEAWRHARSAMRPSGNEAFDAYKAETLRRLEEEQTAFEEFLARLRAAKDKAEFDQFMADRAREARRPATDGEPA